MARKSGSSQNKRQWIFTLTTIAILGAGFAYYFLGYVKVKEANLNERVFRILTLLGDNIEKKTANELRIAKNDIRESYLSDTSFKLPRVNNIPDSVKYPWLDSKQDVIYVQDTVYVKDTITTEAVLYEFPFRIELNSHLESLLRKELFKDYIIIKDDILLYTTLNSGFQVQESDSLLKSNLGYHIGSVQDLEIGGIIYKVYLQPYQFYSESWLIGGLMEKREYRKLSMGVSPTIIMLIFLGTALSLLSIPFLKLVVMSALERLNTADVLFTTLSLISGCSILVIIMLHVYRNKVDNRSQEQELKSFTEKISDSFIDEIGLIYEQLESFDVPNESPQLDSNAVSPQLDSNAVYPLFQRVFWIDSKGWQLAKFERSPDNFLKSKKTIRIQGRSYFNDHSEDDKKSWWLGDKNFAFQSIYGWAIGNTSVVVSKLVNEPTKISSDTSRKNSMVVGLSSFLYSVYEPIVPLGYSYVVIDEQGEVLLHSDKAKNLQENFITETEDDPKLRSAIYARRSQHLDLRYLGTSHDGYIHPIPSLPLFIVGLKDQEHYRTLRAQTLNFTLLHNFLFFTFFMALAILSRVLRFPKSRFKKIKLLYSWIWPLEKNKKVYLDIVMTNSIIIILLLLFTSFFINKDEQGAVMLYSASIYSFSFTFYSLNGSDYFRRNKLFIVALAIIIGLSWTYSIMNSYWIAFAFQIISFISLFYRVGRLKIVQAMEIRYRTGYILMLISWLFVISIIPSMQFYRASYNLEVEVATKHVQVDMAKKMAASWTQWSESNRQNFFNKLDSTPIQDSLKLLNVKDSVLLIMKLNGRGDFHTEHVFESIDFIANPDTILFEEGFEFNKDLSTLVRPFYNWIVIENNNLVFDYPRDHSWWWDKDNEDLEMVYTNYQLPKSDSIPESALVFRSSLNHFFLPLFDEASIKNNQLLFSILFWIVFFLIFFVGLFYLIDFTVRSIFVQLPLHSNLSEIDRKLFQDDKSGKNVFLIGLPQSGKTAFLDKMYPLKTESDLYIVNLIDVHYKKSWDSVIKEAMDSKINVVLVNFFEYNLGNKNLTTQKLQLLEQLMLFPEKKIIVSTSVHLTNIEELYSSDGIIDEDDREAIYRWTELFKNFYEVYFPLQGIASERMEYKYDDNPTQLINDLIIEEFDHGYYLRDLRPEIIKMVEENEKNGTENDHDQIILKLQSLSAVYYHSLWSTCTENEKYVIYDLAEDGLVNAKNVHTIEMLINKGLIIYKDVLQVMNESFRNFVLTKIGPSDALKMEKKAREGGNWSSFRNPIIVILLAVGVFLLVTQQDNLNSFFSFLTPFIVIVPALIRISMLLSRGKDRSGMGDEDD